VKKQKAPSRKLEYAGPSIWSCTKASSIKTGSLNPTRRLTMPTSIMLPLYKNTVPHKYTAHLTKARTVLRQNGGFYFSRKEVIQCFQNYFHTHARDAGM
jgi:hypothetical protein